jgi:hypothetical protein
MEHEMRPGTLIEVKGWDLANREVWRPAKIGRLPRADRLKGYEPITYPDGGKVLAHTSQIRTITPVAK